MNPITGKRLRNYDIFLRAIGKLSPEDKKKIYDYIEMVDNLEKKKRRRKK